MSRTSHLLSQWARRSTDERLLNHLLPRVVRECTEYPTRWTNSPRALVSTENMRALAKSDYQTLMVLLPRVTDPDALHVFVSHHSKQVRHTLSMHPHLSDADREQLLRRARREKDTHVVRALAQYASCETLDELRKDGYGAFHLGWARAVARRDDAMQFVREYLASSTAEPNRVEALAKCVGDGSLTGLSYTEFLDLVPERRRLAAAGMLLLALPVVTTEALRIALAYFDEPGPTELTFPEKTAFTDDALLLAVTQAKGSLRPQLVRRAAKNPVVLDRLFENLEHADPQEESVLYAVRELVKENVTPANRVASLLVRVVEPFSDLTKIRPNYEEQLYLERHAGAIKPQLLARLVPYVDRDVIEKWVAGKLGVTPPPLDVVRHAIEKAKQLRHATDYVFLNWNQFWPALASDPERLDYVVDLIGPPALELITPEVIERIAQRFDEAAKDNVKVADLLLALAENWDGTLTQLIETAHALSLADDLDFTA